VQPAQIAGWSRLQELRSGIFSSLVIPADLAAAVRLVPNGRPGRFGVLSGSPGELFREGSQARLIGDWLRKHYGQLRKPMAEIARRVPGAGNADIWVDALFACAHHGTAASVDSVAANGLGFAGGFFPVAAHGHPVAAGGVVCRSPRRLLPAGTGRPSHRHHAAGPGRVGVRPRRSSSSNQDVWQATFAHHLPSAVEDRLTSSQFLLRGTLGWRCA